MPEPGMKRFAKTVFCLFLLGTIPAQTQTNTEKGQVKKAKPKPAKNKQQVVKKGIKKIGPSTPITVISKEAKEK